MPAKIGFSSRSELFYKGLTPVYHASDRALTKAKLSSTYDIIM